MDKVILSTDGSRFARSFDAANQVFQITELVEMVLLNLDCIELMRAKCVSKMFKAVVESSPAARKALWVDAPGASMKVVSLHPIFACLDFQFSVLEQHCECNPFCARNFATGTLSVSNATILAGMLTKTQVPTTWCKLPAFNCSRKYFVEFMFSVKSRGQVIYEDEDDDDEDPYTQMLEDQMTPGFVVQSLLDYAKTVKIADKDVWVAETEFRMFMSFNDATMPIPEEEVQEEDEQEAEEEGEVQREDDQEAEEEDEVSGDTDAPA